ncbi:Sialic acid transporter NanT [Streptomyces antimycoticus]
MNTGSATPTGPLRQDGAAPATTRLSGAQRKAIVAGTIGNTVEWVDWALYSIFAKIIADEFFPKGDGAVALLSTLAVFAVGFVMRPVGAAVLGAYADRHGRKKGMTLTVGLMAAAGFVIAITPSYETIGVVSPLLLLVARLVQGFSAGGEFGSSSAFLVESAARGRRAFAGSWQQVSVAGGVLVASLLGTLATSALSEDALHSWGWRVAFILGGLLGLVGLWLRVSVADTDSFAQVRGSGRTRANPVKAMFVEHPGAALRVAGITVAGTLTYYIWVNYLPTYANLTTGIPLKTALLSQTLCLVVFVIALPLVGVVSDRLGRKPTMAGFAGGFVVLAWPLRVAHLHSWGPAVASDNVEGYLWAKAGFGAMLAATALADAPMADLIDRHRPAMAALTGEIFAVSDRLGVTLEAFDAFEPHPFRRGADPAAQDAAFDRLTAWLRTQTKDRSGIWRDLAVRHRPVEAPTHYTEVFDHAAREGLPTPLLHTVVTGLRQLEGAAQNMSESRLDELDRLAQPPAPSLPLPLGAEQADAVRQWLDAHREDMVADLAAYTSQGSASDDLDALDSCLGWLRDWLDRRLGAPDAEETLAREEAGDILVRRYSARGTTAQDHRPVLLLGHYDTVWPTGTLDTWPFRREGDHITGPGVFDMKAGLVQAVWALRALDALDLPRPACTVMLNGDEETGSLASRDAIVEEARDSRLAMVFEAAADGAIKTARKGVGLFTVTVTGVEAHAGLDPTAGASAVDELAHQILRLTGPARPGRGHLAERGCGGGRHPQQRHGGARRRPHRHPRRHRRRTKTPRRRPGRSASRRPTPCGGHRWLEPPGVRTHGRRGRRTRRPGTPVRRAARHDLPEASVGGASNATSSWPRALRSWTVSARWARAHTPRSENTSVQGMVTRAALAATILAALARE